MLDSTGRRIEALDEPSRIVMITNPTVRRLYGARLTRSLKVLGRPLSTIELPDGERYKTMTSVEKIYDAVLDGGADRSLVVVALGGGVIGDVAGFAAATLLRGVRLVMVPTTLLAQVDSSVGGKTGVNRPHGKNLVGAFHQPSLVVTDTSTLTSLPPREFRAGLAEVVKYGVVLSRRLFLAIERDAEAIVERDAQVLTRVVADCCRIKARVVARDEREAGMRRVLNYGHTLGHAVEKLTGYRRYLHGEAVAMGMVAAARVSARLGACRADDADRIEALLVRLGLETELPKDLTRAALRDAVGYDKKRKGSGVQFIVNEGIGKFREQLVRPSELVALL